MGRIKLRPLLALGLVAILVFSLVASALGVAALVRKYLWNRAAVESREVSRNVTRFLENRSDRSTDGRVRARRNWPGARGLRRFNRGPGQLLLLKDGAIVLGEDSEDEWAGIETSLELGFHRVEFNNESWLVLTEDVNSHLADQIAVVRPWTPSLKLLRSLFLYQIGVAFLVLSFALAIVAYFASRLAKPLEELMKQSQSVGKGSTEFKQSSAVVEIAQLQSAFQAMSERVEKAMASQQRFVADASHELKSPLTAMTGMLELLQGASEMEPKDRERAINVAKREADRMQYLIEDLLLLSRAQSKRSGDRSALRLKDLILEQIAALSVMFPEQEFEVLGDGDLSYEMNSMAFARVARNLLENAARHGGGSKVKVEVGRDDSEIFVSVSDLGPGIEPEKQSHLFERFFRTDSGRARAEGGHGLGLSIVKALVEEVGGGIVCDSEPGRGTEFRVTFPAHI